MAFLKDLWVFSRKDSPLPAHAFLGLNSKNFI